MSNAKHTPGPWSWTEDRRLLFGGDECVLRTHTLQPVGAADAALLAAAPDPLRACEVALECADMSGAVLAMLMDAIKKARGGA